MPPHFPGHQRRWLALALALLACACRSARAERPAFFAEIEARNRHLEQQFAAGNLLGVADVYADDAVLLDARGNRTAGRAELDEYWAAIAEPLEWRLVVRSIRGSGDLAYELGTSHLSTLRDGAPHISSSDFLLVWRRSPAGPWQIVLDAYWPLE